MSCISACLAAACFAISRQPSHWLSDDRTGRMSGAAPAPACAAIEASAPNLVSKAQLPPEVAFPVGSKVDALDVAGTWYEAKLVDERGQGDARELLVHYNGWKARYDEWVGAGSGRGRAAGNGKLGPCKRLAAATKMETGSRVEALDPRGTWYAAAVEDARGTGLSRELLVHYNGWNKRQDEWMGVCSGRLRASGGKLDRSKPSAASVPKTAHSSAAPPESAPLGAPPRTGAPATAAKAAEACGAPSVAGGAMAWTAEEDERIMALVRAWPESGAQLQPEPKPFHLPRPGAGLRPQMARDRRGAARPHGRRGAQPLQPDPARGRFGRRRSRRE